MKRRYLGVIRQLNPSGEFRGEASHESISCLLRFGVFLHANVCTGDGEH